MRIEITTDGGFTGRGVGSASVDSDEHEDVARALANARPGEWRDDYPARGGDLVRYTMTVGDRSVSWMTGAALPRDLEELFEVVWELR